MIPFLIVVIGLLTVAFGVAVYSWLTLAAGIVNAFGRL